MLQIILTSDATNPQPTADLRSVLRFSAFQIVRQRTERREAELNPTETVGYVERDSDATIN